MIIVLEGPDLAGKTTFARELEADGFQYHHSGPLKGDAKEAYLDPLDAMSTGDHVLDRWHLGELFYGPLLRGESKVTPKLLDEIETQLTALGAMRLIVTAPLQVIRDRHAERGDDLLSLEQIEKAHAFYDAWLEHDTRWRRIERFGYVDA